MLKLAFKDGTRKRQRCDQQLPLLPLEIWLIVFQRVDETSQAICMHVCREWRELVLSITRGVMPRLLARNLASSVTLLVWQQDVLLRCVHVRMQQLAATWMFCGFSALPDARGTLQLVFTPQQKTILLFCSTLIQMGARGTLTRALSPPKEAILLFCSTLMKMDAHGVH